MTLEEAFSDPRISWRAKGLLAYYHHSGRVTSADSSIQLGTEGRDLLRRTQKELITYGYIIKQRMRDHNGQTYTVLSLPTTDLPTTARVGVLSIDSQLANSSKLKLDSSQVINPNGFITYELALRAELSTFKEQDSEEYLDMAWPGLDDEQPAIKQKAKRSAPAEEEAGAVGKLPDDKRAMRQSKYATKTELAGRHRTEKPEDQWTTTDIVAEFYWLTEQHAPGVPSQVSSEVLSKWINRQVGQGVARKSILKGVRRFFNDPRVISDAGVGKPLYRRFMAFYPTVHGIVSRDVLETDTSGFDISARSVEKFLSEAEED